MSDFSIPWWLLGYYNSILHLGVFVFGEDPSRDKLMSIGVWSFGNNPISLLRRDPWERGQIVLWGFIYVNRTLGAESVFQSLSNGLRVALQCRSFLGRVLSDLIGILVCTTQ
jgi:hypothetical protein